MANYVCMYCKVNSPSFVFFFVFILMKFWDDRVAIAHCLERNMKELFADYVPF